MAQSILKRATGWALSAVFAVGILGTAVPAEATPPAHAPAHGYRRKQAAQQYRNPRYGTTYYRTRRSVDIDRDGIPDYRDRWITRRAYVSRRTPTRVYTTTRRARTRVIRGKDTDRDGVRNRRDRDNDNDGVRDRRDDHPKNPRRR